MKKIKFIFWISILLISFLYPYTATSACTEDQKAQMIVNNLSQKAIDKACSGKEESETADESQSSESEEQASEDEESKESDEKDSFKYGLRIGIGLGWQGIIGSDLNIFAAAFPYEASVSYISEDIDLIGEIAYSSASHKMSSSKKGKAEIGGITIDDAQFDISATLLKIKYIFSRGGSKKGIGFVGVGTGNVKQTLKLEYLGSSYETSSTKGVNTIEAGGFLNDNLGLKLEVLKPGDSGNAFFWRWVFSYHY